jgi:regulator of nucleoside diphosphate kinase
MFVSDVCQLTTKDYTVLEIMLDWSTGSDELMRSILSRKLSSAIVTLRDLIPPTVVTLGSRVTYRIDNGSAETRIVGDADDMRGLVGLTVIPISRPRGLAMLGLAEGASATLRPQNGPAEKITVLKVVDQPEAARRSRGSRPRLFGNWTTATA